ncbi:MAG: hypothetical protein WC451_03100 [Patescibacteria group bacterium]|jgi:hypothetical protein
MKVYIKSKFIDELVYLSFDFYSNGSMSISGRSLEGEPLFKATVALEDGVPRKGYVILKGWSENEGIPEALEKAGVVKRTGRTIQTGFCIAEEAKLLKQEIEDENT